MSAKKKRPAARSDDRNFLDDMRIATTKYRADAHLNQTELARMLGVSRSAISNWESGVSVLREEAMATLYRILRSPLLIIADRLRSLADYLVCPDIDERTKFKELTAFSKSLSNSLDGMVDSGGGGTD